MSIAYGPPRDGARHRGPSRAAPALRRARPPTRGRAPPAAAQEAGVPTLQDVAQDLMKLDGALAFAFVDHTNGLMLASATSVPYDTEFVRAKLRAVEQMGRGGAVEDILVTLHDELHLTLVCDHPRLQGVFGYLALDRSRGNLALARRTLRSLGGSVEL